MVIKPVEPTIEYIKQLVPLRFPVLLVDRVLEWTPGERIRALKAFTADEPFFGTDTQNASVPIQALMLEAMVQVAGLTLPKRPGKYVYLRGIDDVEFHGHARIGDVMVTFAEKTAERGAVFRVRADSRIEDNPILSGEITYVYLDSDVDA